MKTILLEKEEFDAYLEIVQAALKLLRKHEEACSNFKKIGRSKDEQQ